MPLPKPNDGESKNDFMDRCMSNDTMNDEYPDNDQRYAVCQTIWEDRSVSKKEIRNMNIPVKVEKREDGTVKSIIGYPIVYNKDSEDMGFIERIAQGAAKKALERSDIRGLKNHDPSLIFARSGINLTFKDTKEGLYYEATPIDTQNYREISKEIEAGLLTGQSFGFTIKSDEWRDLDTDKPVRTITEIEQIFDVGPVTYPAYTDTSVALRSLEKAKENIEDKTIKVKFNNTEIIFHDINEFEGFADAMIKKRFELNPMINDSDNTDDVPMDEKSSGKEVFERMSKTIDKYKKEVES